jgi:hypothetical protein
VFLENDTPGFVHDRAVATERWKLRNVDGVEELYDLASDPTEVNPLDPSTPALRETAHRLRSILSAPSAWRPSR